jgi:hypothetical protein
MAPTARVISLGTAATDAATLLIDEGLLDQERCLLGIPHPSGSIGHRVKQYNARRETLAATVAHLAAANAF